MVKKNEKLEPLVYHVAMIGANISYLNQYQNQLQLLLKDACKPLSTDNLTYKTNALSTLIDLYNGCFSASVPANIQPKKKGKLEVGALLGVNISTLNYSRYDNTSSINTEDDWKVTPTAGVFINFVAPRLQGRLALQNEVLYYNRQRTFTLDEVTYKSLYTYDFSYIGLNNILRYSVLTTQPSLYVLAGFSNGFVVRGKTYLQKVGFGNSDKVSFDGQYRKHEQALIVGIGTQIKRFSIEARYLRGNGFSAFVSTRSLTKSTSCVLKYHFY